MARKKASTKVMSQALKRAGKKKTLFADEYAAGVKKRASRKNIAVKVTKTKKPAKKKATSKKSLIDPKGWNKSLRKKRK